eukprot:scaffold293712_cov32-Tisochrysis_lutea.AAC.1
MPRTWSAERSILASSITSKTEDVEYVSRSEPREYRRTSAYAVFWMTTAPRMSALMPNQSKERQQSEPRWVGSSGSSDGTSWCASSRSSSGATLA